MCPGHLNYIWTINNSMENNGPPIQLQKKDNNLDTVIQMNETEQILNKSLFNKVHHNSVSNPLPSSTAIKY